jgi:hypothetical protein
MTHVDWTKERDRAQAAYNEYMSRHGISPGVAAPATPEPRAWQGESIVVQRNRFRELQPDQKPCGCWTAACEHDPLVTLLPERAERTQSEINALLDDAKAAHHKRREAENKHSSGINTVKINVSPLARAYARREITWEQFALTRAMSVPALHNGHMIERAMLGNRGRG